VQTLAGDKEGAGSVEGKDDATPAEAPLAISSSVRDRLLALGTKVVKCLPSMWFATT
jgi:hypothetical protein